MLSWYQKLLDIAIIELQKSKIFSRNVCLKHQNQLRWCWWCFILLKIKFTFKNTQIILNILEILLRCNSIGKIIEIDKEIRNIDYNNKNNIDVKIFHLATEISRYSNNR